MYTNIGNHGLCFQLQFCIDIYILRSIHPCRHIHIHIHICTRMHIHIYRYIWVPCKITHFSFYLSIYLSICLSIYLSIYLSIHLSIYPSHLSIYPYLFISIHIYPSIDLSIYRFIHLWIHLSIYLSIHPSIYLCTSTHWYIYILLMSLQSHNVVGTWMPWQKRRWVLSGQDDWVPASQAMCQISSKCVPGKQM